MTTSVTINGNTYTDDDNPETGFDGGGHRRLLLPLVRDIVTVAGAVVSDAGTTSTKASQASASSTAAAASAAVASAAGANATAAAAAAAALASGSATARPTIRPSLLLDVANSGGVDPRLAFARSTIGSRINSAGLVESVLAGVPRVTHDPVGLNCRGLTIEEARTNLLQHSSDFTQAVWMKTAVQLDAARFLAPDGTLSAFRVYETTANVAHTLGQSFSIAANTNYDVSMWLKAAERSKARLQVGNFGNQVATNVVEIDLLTGAYTASDLNRTYVQAFRDGWYRVASTILTTAAPGSLCTLTMTVMGSGASTTYAGDGVSGVLAWLGQAELGEIPTSPIVTAAAQVARTAETCSIAAAPWLRQGDGTLYVEFVRVHAVSAAAAPRVLTLHDGTASNRIAIVLSRSGGNSQVGALITAGGVDVVATAAAFTPNTPVRVALAWRAADAALYVNGVEVWTGSSAAIPAALTTLSLGTDSAGANHLNGSIGRVAYYPARLAAVHCQALTA